MPRPPASLVANVLAVPAVLYLLGVFFVADPGGATVSAVENRKLAGLPVYSFHALRDGTFTRDLDLYVADHFPLREAFVGGAFWVKAHLGLANDSTVYEVPDLDEGGMEHNEDWVNEEADAGEEVEGFEAAQAGADAGEEEDAGLAAPPVAAASPGVPKKRPKLKNGILITGGRAIQLFTGDEASAEEYARVVNTYARDLGDQVTVYSVVTPTSAAFYLPDDERDRSGDERANLEALRAHLDPKVRYADIYAQLARHVKEDIFFRTDHHWTALGSWYGYSAFCEAAGLTPTPLAGLEKRTRPLVNGSYYRMTKDPTLHAIAEAVDFYLPPVEYKAVRYTGPAQDVTQPTSFLNEKERGYGVFLGGDEPMLVARTAVKNGRRALLVKNSYGNAFAPWLLPHFEELVVVDYRYTRRSVSQLVKSHRITDVIILGATTTVNAGPHRRRLLQLLHRAGASWAAVNPELEAAKFSDTRGGGVAPADGGVR